MPDATQLSPYLTSGNAAMSNTGYVNALQLGQNTFNKGVDSLGTGLAEAIQTHKQNVQDAANLDTTFHMLVPELSKAGVPASEYADSLQKYGSSSLSAKRGIVGGLATQYALAQKTKMEQAQQQELTARAGYYNDVGTARVQAQQEQADTYSGLTAFANELGSVKPSGDDGSYTQADMIKAMGSAGAKLNPRAQAALIGKIFPQMLGPGAKQYSPQTTEIPGSDNLLVTYGGSSYVIPKKGGQPGAGGPTPAPAAGPGPGPTVSKDGKFYYDDHFKTWKPLSAGGGAPRAGAKALNTRDRLDQILNGTNAPVAGGVGASPAAAAPPQDHINYLMQHPESAASFDAKYGQGASDQYLNQ